MYDIELFRPLTLDGIFLAEKNRYCCDFKAWIASGQYLINNIKKEKFSLSINNYHSFSHCMFFDASRMASAAFESIQIVTESPLLPRSFAWNAIKIYYSAFFAAHSIMRCFGRSCSQLEQGHLKLILEHAAVLGIKPNKLTSGYFSIGYERKENLLTLIRVNKTHEDMWKDFTVLLSNLSADILKVQGVQSNIQYASSYLTDLVAALTDNGRLQNGSFLSTMRNAINYRQEHGAWFPYYGANIDLNKIRRITTSWNHSDVISTSGNLLSKDVYNFFWLSTNIVNFCYKLIKDIAQ